MPKSSEDKIWKYIEYVVKKRMVLTTGQPLYNTKSVLL